MNRGAPSIQLHNRQRGARLDVTGLQDFAERALQLCLERSRRRSPNLTSLTKIDIVLVSDRRISTLHRKFMNIPGATDVITFQHGEIFVSVETALRQARRYRSSVEKEIKLYLVHGLLHLEGFDDTSAVKARAMESAQTRLLSALEKREGSDR